MPGSRKPTAQLHLGDCVQHLRTRPDNSVDCVVTDPPYGLSTEPNMVEVLTHWLAGDDYVHQGSGFMGKTWDSFVPGPTVWREVFRVLKPGGYALVFAGTRTVDLMGISLRLAGFEIRDTTHWTYGSGFPKSMNVSMAIDKHLGKAGDREVVGVKPGHEGFVGNESAVKSLQNPVNGQEGGFARPWMDDPEAVARYRMATKAATPEAAAWDGYGTTLKPTHEPIIICRKPPIGTIAENILQHGVGGLNIDGCRVPYQSSGEFEALQANRKHERTIRAGAVAEGYGMKPEGLADTDQSPLGRWPGNTILTHGSACERVGTRKVKPRAASPVGEGYVPGNDVYNQGVGANPHAGFLDQDGLETIEDWRCAPGCPVALLDAQSGPREGCKPHVIHSSEEAREGRKAAGWGSIAMPSQKFAGYDDEGGASRFLNTLNWSEDDFAWLPFLYVPKAARSEREAGLDALLKGKTEGPMAGRGQPGLKCRSCGKWKASGSPCVCPTPDFEPVAFERPDVANIHPTVKPLSLMRWLVRLVCPPQGTVLDPFTGSGTTGCAALLEGFDFQGCEIGADYHRIASARLAYYARCTLDPKTREIMEPRPEAKSLFEFMQGAA